MQVLIVDDDEFARLAIDGTVTRMGHTAVLAKDGVEALKILRRGEIHLVITDWDMPEMNGLELCRAIRREDFSGYVYVIMLTGREGAKQRLEGLCAGADDFLNKPLDPEELLVCLKTADRILSLETRDLALFALAKLAESRDAETGAHIERVQNYTRLIAQHLSPEVRALYGVDEEYIRLLFQTSPLHDLGKVAIPDAILLKPGKLTDDEFAVMKTHTVVGAQTLDAALQRFSNTRFLQIAREIAVSHHEKFDGSGYPHGLAGEQIPLCGRIVAIADVYDALTSRRVYKDASTHQQAKAIILKERGAHFDPEVVDAFLRAEQQILQVYERLRDNIASPKQAIALPVPPPPAADRPIPCTVLVVEDDPISLMQITELLSSTGENVITAVDGRDAIGMLSTHGPRVVVSDWMMPNVDGVALCRHVRSQPGIEPVHFIMLTAHADKSRLLDAFRVGVDDFVAKPFDAEELLARVRAGIRAAKLHDDLVRRAAGSQSLNAQLATVNSRLERLTITDELTGVFNRRHAMSCLDEQWALSTRYSRLLSIAMIDIDHFKAINDTYGHDAGDAILRQVASILRDHTRGTEALCRVGGEEFLIIFRSQTVQEAAVGAERCRQAVEAYKFQIGGTPIKVTVSIGLATRHRAMAQDADLLKTADQALYAAKHAGRNVVRIVDYLEEKAAMSNSSPTPDQACATPPLDNAALLKRCGGDPKFAAAVTQKFTTQAPREVADIERAVAAGDPVGARRGAHNLKSMCAYMAAETASEQARQIEDLAAAGRMVEIAPVLVHLRAEIERTAAWLAQHATAA